MLLLLPGFNLTVVPGVEQSLALLELEVSCQLV
jgi:hypothetical protein